MVCSLQLPYSTHITDEEAKTQRDYLIYSQKHKLGLKYSNSWFANPGSWILFYIQCITFLIYNFFSYTWYKFPPLMSSIFWALLLLSWSAQWVNEWSLTLARRNTVNHYVYCRAHDSPATGSYMFVLIFSSPYILDSLEIRTSNLFLFQFCFVFFLSFFFKCNFHLQVLIYTSLLSCQLFTPTFRHTGYYHIFLNNFLHGIKIHIYIVKPT